MDPRLQLDLAQARHRELVAQAEGDRLAQEARLARLTQQPQLGERANVLVGLGDFLIACGQHLKGVSGSTRETGGTGTGALIPAELTRGMRALPEMALRICQVEGDVTYSLIYTRMRSAAAPSLAPGTYYTLTWLARPHDVHTAGACPS